MYPLIKTHKLRYETYPGPEMLPPLELPVRMVTSCTNAMTGRATALLQHIYGGICSDACGSEYCKDTPDYLRSLQTEDYLARLSQIQSQDHNEKELFIVALDVQGPYPNSPRKYVTAALKSILEKKFPVAEVKTLVNLTKFCLENTVISNNNKPYIVTEGILTGASNSTSLADAFLTNITIQVRQSQMLLLWKRFIDDIIGHFYGSRSDLDKFIGEVELEFSKFDMKIDARIAFGSAEEEKDRQVEFLDVNHVFTEKNFYKTENFIKPTATDRRFISGESYHPIHVFKGIVAGEAKRLRRLNSTDEGWFKSLENLEGKCYRSQFNKDIVKDMINKVKENDEGQVVALAESEKKTEMTNIPWATSIPRKLLKITDKQNNLLQNQAKLQPIYKRPPSLRDQLPACRYRKIINPPPPILGTQPCGNCLLCGTRKSKGVKPSPMIKMTDTTTTFTRTGTKISLKSTLNCKNYGIYQLRCRRCMNEDRKSVGTYVGMTTVKFSTRFGSHRGNFNFNITDTNNDNYAIAGHYKTAHKITNANDLPKFEEAYELVFLEEPAADKIRQCEDKWRAMALEIGRKYQYSKNVDA